MTEGERSREELEPCPFCGGPAYRTESVNGTCGVYADPYFRRRAEANADNFNRLRFDPRLGGSAERVAAGSEGEAEAPGGTR